MRKIKWVKFERGMSLPQERRLVFVQIDKDDAIGMPPAVVIGYLRYAAGDKGSPCFIVPGFGRKFNVTHWSSALPRYFQAPLWNMPKPHGLRARIWR